MAKWALVTGASSGIGKEFAVALAEKGMNLVLVARRTEPMERQAVQLRAEHPGLAIRVEGADLSVPGAGSRLKERLDAEGVFVATLVNNAAFGLIGEFLDQPKEKIAAMLQLNVLSLTELTRIFGESMKQRGGGRILMVASLAAYQPSPNYAAYAATKAYVLSFGVALHHELAAHKVGVTVLSPGVTETEFFDVAGQQPSAAMQRMMMKPRAVVEVGLAALDRGRSSVVAGRMNRILALTSRLFSRDLASKISYRAAKE